MPGSRRCYSGGCSFAHLGPHANRARPVVGTTPNRCIAHLRHPLHQRLLPAQNGLAAPVGFDRIRAERRRTSHRVSLMLTVSHATYGPGTPVSPIFAFHTSVRMSIT